MINNLSDSNKNNLLTKTKLIFSDASPENPKSSFWSTRWWDENADYEYVLSHAQPRNRWLWYRDEFPEKVLTEEQKNEFIKILREAVSIDDNDLIREVIKSMFRFLWLKMWTWLSGSEIEEVVNSLDSFESPFIVPVEKIWNNWIYLINETTWLTNAFKDLALQQVTTMLSVITKRNNKKAVADAISDKQNGITYTFEWEKLVKFKDWEKEKEQKNRPKLTFVITQTSTSWDTGPAWWAWIEWRPFSINVIWFPISWATYWQAGQMLMLKENVIALAMNEWFTRIQEEMKACNNDEFKAKLKKILEHQFRELRQEYWFDLEVSSWSFNSVNQWRIDWQAIYHSLATFIAKALNPEIQWDIIEALPSGNFGHAKWAMQWKNMVWWIDDIIASTNENDAIYLLIANWKYVMATSEVSSPSVSMIIRYWSNVERVLREITSPERCAELMHKFEFEWTLLEAWEKYLTWASPDLSQFIEATKHLKKMDIPYNSSFLMGAISKNARDLAEVQRMYGQFKEEAWIQLTKKEHQKLKNLWLKTYRVETADELDTIRHIWLEEDRLICPHTANAYFAALQYRKENPDKNRNSILVSETASPWKFLAAIATALTCIDKSEMTKKYLELRELEKTKEWIVSLLEMIRTAYRTNWKEFNENVIPKNLKTIYNNWFAAPAVLSASEFWFKTLQFTENYAPKFEDQVRLLIEENDLQST